MAAESKPDDGFLQWLSSPRCDPTVRQWASTIILEPIGATSWECFRGKNAQGDAENAFVNAGIPALAAKQIARSILAEIARRQKPLSVFWDFDNFPVSDVRDTLQRIKAALSSYGQIERFKVYTQKSSLEFSTDERKAFQQEKCDVVEGSNAREIEKLLIVDAAIVAEKHAVCNSGSSEEPQASFCFISDDPDLSILIKKFQKTLQIILVVREDTSGDVEVACDVKFLWENNIAASEPPTNLSWVQFADSSIAASALTEEGIHQLRPTNEAAFNGVHDSMWEQKLAALESTLGFEAPQMSVEETGRKLIETYPALFPSNAYVTEFLETAIQLGLISKPEDVSTQSTGFRYPINSPYNQPTNVPHSSIQIQDPLGGWNRSNVATLTQSSLNASASAFVPSSVTRRPTPSRSTRAELCRFYG